MEKFYLNRQKQSNSLYRLYSRPELTYDGTRSEEFEAWLQKGYHQQAHVIGGFRKSVKNFTLDRLEGIKAHLQDKNDLSETGREFHAKYRKLCDSLFGEIMRVGLGQPNVNRENLGNFVDDLDNLLIETSAKLEARPFDENVVYFIKRVREKVSNNKPAEEIEHFILSVEIEDYFTNLGRSGTATIDNACEKLLAEGAFATYYKQVLMEKIEHLREEVQQRAPTSWAVRSFERQDLPSSHIETYTLKDKKIKISRNPLFLNEQDEQVMLNRGVDLIIYEYKDGDVSLVLNDLKHLQKHKEKQSQNTGNAGRG